MFKQHLHGACRCAAEVSLPNLRGSQRASSGLKAFLLSELYNALSKFISESVLLHKVEAIISMPVGELLVERVHHTVTGVSTWAFSIE